MQIRECNSVAEIVEEALALMRADRLRMEDRRSDDGFPPVYYFRGERCNFDGGDNIPTYDPQPGIYRDRRLVEHESDIFNEALRAFPEEFAKDRTTFEILTRMQHYGYPTRLLDVTPKLMTALGMVRSLGEKQDKEDWQRNGFVRVYRVRGSRIKYGTSDTVTALSNLARLRRNRVEIDSLEYLEAECKNERAGFFYRKGSETTNNLERDIQKVWCVRPMVNNIRVNFQAGEFFLFGCHDKKGKLEATFDEYGYDYEDSPTYGIAQIATLIVTPNAKKELEDFQECFDISDARLYSDSLPYNRIPKLCERIAFQVGFLSKTLVTKGCSLRECVYVICQTPLLLQ